MNRKTTFFFFVAVLLLLLTSGSNAYSQFLGGAGAVDIRAVSTKNYTTCPGASYINVIQGGDEDGLSMALKEYLTCNTDQAFAGGSGSTETGAGNDELILTTCSGASYTDITQGGDENEHSVGAKVYLTCDPDLPYKGGSSGGGTDVLQQNTCNVAYTNITQGGDEDGQSVSSKEYLSCDLDLPYRGGSSGGYITDVLQQNSCLVAYTNITQGGNNDGHSVDTTYATIINPLCATVSCPVVPDAGTDVTICDGQTTTLDASGSTNGITYTWLPTTGLSNPNIVNPVASPTVSITYTVTVSNGSCSLTDDVIVTVNPSPLVTVSGTTPLCEGEGTTLTATGGGTYLWSHSGETTASVSVTPATTTTYSVTVTNSYSCQTTGTETITVNPLPNAIAGSNRAICGGSSTTLGAADVSGDTYSWAPAASLSSSTISDPSATPASTTTYTLTETVTSTGCQNTNTVTVTVDAAIISGITEICSGGSTTLTASCGDTPISYSWNTTPVQTTASITVAPLSLTTYSVTITDASCTISTSQDVTVNPLPNANTGGDKSICSGQTIGIGDLPVGGNSYSWSPDISISPSNASNPSVNPVSTITYTLTETITATGCSESNFAKITVFPQAGIIGTSSICDGDITTLTATGVGDSPTYLWSTMETTQSIVVNPSSTTSYSVTVSGGDCVSEASRTINVLSTCTTYVDVTGGGNSDGHSLGMKYYLTCNSSTPFLGGFAGGNYAKLLSLANCDPVYTNITGGGSEDGHALGAINYLTCNTETAYLGGIGGGDIALPLSLANCDPVYFSVTQGGEGDGSVMEFPPSCLTALPIELIDFTAKLTFEKDVICNWWTASEINNDYFTVEKTSDGNSYVVVGKVKGAGNTSSLLAYSLMDYQPYTGTSYYRLKQTDYNGSYSYSKLVSIYIKADASEALSLTIFPNPLKAELKADLFNSKELTVNIVITNVLGQEIYFQQYVYPKGNNKITVNMREYSEGVYFLHLFDAASNQSVAIARFVKITE